MATRGTKAILLILKLKDEAVGVVVANNGQGLITIDDFAQLYEKSVEGLCRVIRITGGKTRVGPSLELKCQLWLRKSYKT